MQGIPKTPKIPNGFFSVKVGVFYREVFGTLKNCYAIFGVPKMRSIFEHYKLRTKVQGIKPYAI